MKDILTIVLAAVSVPVLVTYVVLGLLWLYRHVSKQSDELKEKRIAQLKEYFHIGYLGVVDLASRTDNTIDDKIAAAMKLIDDALQADGKPVLTVAQQKAAALWLSAKHGEVLLSSNLAKDAAAVVIPPEAPVKAAGSPS